MPDGRRCNQAHAESTASQQNHDVDEPHRFNTSSHEGLCGEQLGDFRVPLEVTATAGRVHFRGRDPVVVIQILQLGLDSRPPTVAKDSIQTVRQAGNTKVETCQHPASLGAQEPVHVLHEPRSRLLSRGLRTARCWLAATIERSAS